MSTIAFLGLGHMGGPMAANLDKAGYRVLGYDPMPAAREAATAAGVQVVGAAEDAAREADVVITMLPSGRHVLDCYRGADGAAGLLSSARPGTLFVDCSTIDVDDARAAHAAALEAGHRAVDSPVSGGVVGATAGTLTLMVGAAEEDFAAARPVLEPMSGRLVHCGTPGAGQAAKICNNMILGISMIAVSEAFVLGRSLGLSDQALFDVASTASGQCWALTTNCPVPGPVPASPANRDYRRGFATALMTKDMNLAMQAAQSHGVDAVLGLRATQCYRDFLDAGGADKDFSAIITDIQARSGQGSTQEG